MDNSLIEQIKALPVEDRLQLMEEIWESLDAEKLPIPKWHEEELDRRLKAIEEHGSQGIPLDEFLEKLERRRSL